MQFGFAAQPAALRYASLTASARVEGHPQEVETPQCLKEPASELLRLVRAARKGAVTALRHARSDLTDGAAAVDELYQGQLSRAEPQLGGAGPDDFGSGHEARGAQQR